jgi:hypothetical protein
MRDEAGNFMPGVGMSGGIIVEKPGDSFTSSIDLNELYELTPGMYAVQVYVKDSIAKVTVKPNTISIAIFSWTELQSARCPPILQYF